MHRSDTTKEVEKIYDEKIRRLSPEERFSRGLSLTSFCRKICLEQLRQAHPDFSPADIKIRFFEQVYGSDFPENTKKLIYNALRK